MSAEKLQKYLKHCSRHARKMRSRHYKNKGDLHLLHMIYHKYPDGVMPSVIAKDLGVALPTVSQKLSALEDASLIKRIPHPDDRRKTIVTVSEKGLQELSETFNEFMKDWEKVCSKLGEEKTETLTSLLAELHAILEEETEESD